MAMIFKNLLILTGLASLCACRETPKGQTADQVGAQIQAIVDAIIVPQFRNKDYLITDFGAVAGGDINNGAAIAQALKTCHYEGGGRVVVPPGTFLTGPIHLLDNVNLHLEEGSELRFTKDKSAYLPIVHTSFEGVELMNYSPLVYAYQKSNIALTGQGILNGQADTENWWPWCGAERYGYIPGEPQQRDSLNLPRLRTMNERRTPVAERIFGEGHQLRPGFFEPFECQNVLVQGVTFINAPFWVMHPIKCTNVTIDGVTVNSHGPNNDGCDPEYSKNVHIKNCLFDTGDDCIAIKAGRNDDGRRVAIPSENIVVEDCEMRDGHGGVVIGSEISAGVRNVFVRRCRMDSPNLERAIRIKTNTLRGGFVENVYVNDVTIGQVKEAVLKINTHYAIYENQEGPYLPVIKNINLEHVTVKKGGAYGILIQGRAEKPVEGVSLIDVTINGADIPMKVSHCEPIHFENTTINGKAITSVTEE